MAGITIGVVAIASMGMFGATLERSFLNDASGVTETVVVTPGEDAEFGEFTRDHVTRINQYTEYPIYAISERQSTVSAFQSTEQTTVKSISDPEPFITASEGRIPENWRSGALVGASLADTLDVRPGDSITVAGQQHRVVAVLEDAPRASIVNPDNAVLLSSERGQTNTYSQLLVRADSPESAFRVSDRLDASLNGRQERFAVHDAEDAIERFRQQMRTINSFLLGAGGLSLLVAAVSILNVMLMSTIERKGEIGVLRAVGYHRVDVLRLLLSEAVLLGVVGALVGVFLSVLLGMVMNAQLLSDPLAFTREALLYTVIGFLFGTGSSFISGLYPAWKAANARPVEALRD
jgi:putative ABC transport system permease protein